MVGAVFFFVFLLLRQQQHQVVLWSAGSTTFSGWSLLLVGVEQELVVAGLLVTVSRQYLLEMHQ